MSGTRLKFFIQKHKTAHPHYDLRLETRGMLRSWVLPKAIPTKDNEVRLAIEDDEYAHGHISPDEGIVEDGYGEGQAEVWDIGICELGKNSKSKVEFEAKGQRLSGKFVLLLPDWGRRYKKRLWVLIKA